MRLTRLGRLYGEMPRRLRRRTSCLSVLPPGIHQSGQQKCRYDLRILQGPGGAVRNGESYSNYTVKVSRNDPKPCDAKHTSFGLGAGFDLVLAAGDPWMTTYTSYYAAMFHVSESPTFVGVAHRITSGEVCFCFERPFDPGSRREATQESPLPSLPPGRLELHAAHKGRDVEVPVGVRACFGKERTHRLRFLPVNSVSQFR